MDTVSAYQDEPLRTACTTLRAEAAAMYAEARRMAERAAEMIEHAQFARAIAHARGEADDDAPGRTRGWSVGEREDEARDRLKRSVGIGAGADTVHRRGTGEAEHGLVEL